MSSVDDISSYDAIATFFRPCPNGAKINTSASRVANAVNLLQSKEVISDGGVIYSLSKRPTITLIAVLGIKSNMTKNKPRTLLNLWLSELAITVTHAYVGGADEGTRNHQID